MSSDEECEYEQQEEEEQSDCEERQRDEPREGGRKRAFICGVSYTGTIDLLRGCLNDSKNIKYLAKKKWGFEESNILLLNEEFDDPERLPTKANIEKGLHWLVEGCQAGDSLFFFFSGHGGDQKNENGEELDGNDECICPMDGRAVGNILDDYINETIVRPLPEGATLHAIMDCCHSGTVLDLPYLWKLDSEGNYEWEDQQVEGGSYKGTSGGEVYCFSGCRDDQLSFDPPGKADGIHRGALTTAIIKAIERGEVNTHADLLFACRRMIAEYDGVEDQEIQLSASHRYDPYAQPFHI